MKKLLILVFLLLTSCKINFIADLYTSDLIDLANSGNPEIIRLPMEVEFQVADCEDLSDEKRVMSTYFSDFDFLGCDLNSEDFMSYARAKVTVPVTNGSDTVSDLIGFRSYISDDQSFIYVDAIINNNLFEELKKYVYDQTFQELKLSESKLIINLNNDLRNAIVWVMPSFVDNYPIAMEKKFDLQKRQKLIIETSNVANAHLENSSWTPILSIVNNFKS